MRLEFKSDTGAKEMTLEDIEKIIETVKMNGGDPSTVVPKIMITLSGRPKLIQIDFTQHLAQEA